MQGRVVKTVAAVLLLASVLSIDSSAFADDYTAVQIGHTKQHLHDSAGDQPKHYVMQEPELQRRVNILMADVDRLLCRLHALPPETSGTDPVAHPLDKELGSLFEIGLRNNPALQKPRSELAVLAAQTRQSGAAEDPMLMFELMDVSVPVPFQSLQSNQTGFDFGISQMFASYGKRGLRREITSREEDLKEIELAQMELDLMMEITEKYYTLFGKVAELRALDQNIGLMKVLLEMANNNLSLGVTPQAEVLNAQVQLSKMELMRIELNASIEQGYIELAGSLGNCPGLDLKSMLKFDAEYPLPPNIEWNNQELLTKALDRYPAFQRTRLMQEQQDLKVELARREFYPDYQLSTDIKTGAGMGNTITLGVEVPLFLHKQEKQDAQLQEQYAGGAVIQDDANDVENKYITQIKFWEAELGMHSQLVDLYRLGTVPQARLALESNIANYAASSMSSTSSSMSQGSSMSGGGSMGPSMGGGEMGGEGEGSGGGGLGIPGQSGGGMSGSSSGMSGSGSMGTSFTQLIMSQQNLLQQEQELEQNYIHILHTLTDLQVLTMGVFDPAVYYKPVTDSLGIVSPKNRSAAASISDSADELKVESDLPSSDQLPEAEITEPEGFIKDLDLPQGKDKPVAKDSSGHSTGSPDSNKPSEEEFHKPFVPKRKKDD